MLAVDTNLVVRYLTADHPDQSPKAKALIEAEDVFVSTTVLLETEWVLRSVYGFCSIEAARVLAAFCGLAGVTLEDTALAAEVLDRSARGMNFNDALHVAKARGRDAFATFDRRIAKAAEEVCDIEVRIL